MIGLIAAYASNYTIGYQGRIPWKINGEQRRFRELTTGNVVIMGRRSFEEIGRPLPGRDTILLSRSWKYESDRCTTVTSLEEAIALCQGRKAYISGGAGIYQEAIPYVDIMYITEIQRSYPGDTFFPQGWEADFHLTERTDYPEEPVYSYLTYERIIRKDQMK